MGSTDRWVAGQTMGSPMISKNASSNESRRFGILSDSPSSGCMRRTL